MRVLIFNESALDILDSEREAGNHSSLRSSEPSLFSVGQLEKANRVHCWSRCIADAYADRAEVVFHGNEPETKQSSAKPKPSARRRGK